MGNRDTLPTGENRREFLKHSATFAAGASALAVSGCLGGGEGQATETEAGDAEREPVYIPGLYDMTGPTSDVGRPAGIGSRDSIEYVNENDVIDWEIDHEWVDYAYDVPTAKQYYDEWTSSHDPPAIIGWGTGDTEALAPQVARDKIVYVSASYSPNLLKAETPYNFIGNLDYASQARMHLKWIAENDPDATVAFIFNTTPFGKAPVEGGKLYAEELELDLAPDIALELTANSAKTQLRKAKNNDVDYLIHQNTSAPMQVLLKDRQDVYPEVNVMGLTYTVDEYYISQSPDLYEGVRYASAFKTFQEALDSGGKGADAIRASFDREGRVMDNVKVAQLNYVRGFIHGLLIMKGIESAGNEGLDPSNGEDLRKGMLGIDGWDVRGLAEPYDYKEGDRRPTMNGRIYQVTDGEMQYDTTFELPRREDWIGL